MEITRKVKNNPKRFLGGGVSPFVPKCPVLSPFVLFCPLLSPFRAPRRTKEDNGDKTGHFRTHGETPPFSIYPHLALLVKFGIFLKGGDLNPGERHLRDTRDDGTVTLCTLRAATVLSRDCRADFWSSLDKEGDVALA